MKRAFILLFYSFFACTKIIYSQNLPLGPGPTPIPGSITNVIPLPDPYTLSGTTPVVNYVVTFEPQYPTTDATSISETTSPSGMKMNTVYFDGFSRKMETIIRENVSGYDLVTPYDNRPGPNQYSYSPYAVSPSDPLSIIHADPWGEQNTFYSGLFPDEAGTAINESSYYSDAMSRSTSNYLPGKSNIGQIHGTKTAISSNVASEVIIWKIDPSSSWPTNAGYYAPGTLVKKITTNDDLAEVLEYYDNENKLIYKSVLTDGTATYASTYYVYDIYDRLTYTLHPKAVQYLSLAGWASTSEIINNLCDFVIYDNYGRVVESHVAGENGNNKCVYDQHNRVALYSKPNDAVSATPWWFNHYDKLNRIIQSGNCNTTTSRATIQSWFDNNSLDPSVDNVNNIFYYLFHENQQGIYPSAVLAGATMYTSNFYDSYYSSYYDFTTGTPYAPLNVAYDPTIFTSYLWTDVTTIAPPSTASLKTQGKLTNSVSRVVLPIVSYTLPSYQPFTAKTYIYDDYERNIETININIHNDKDVTGIQYNFKGAPIRKISNYANHECTANPHTNIATYYTYDPYTANLMHVFQYINGSPSGRDIIDYKYNHLGQVSTKNIGGTIETQALTYNIRNQLTGINPTFATSGVDVAGTTFGEAIYYDAGFTRNLYCGGISGIIWRSTGEFPQAYGYTYDNAGRLTQADYREYYSVTWGTLMLIPSWTNAHTDYTEGGITYDANGNILTLNRYGPIDYGTYTAPGVIDNLTYTYGSSAYGLDDKSNQVQKVSDAVSLATTSTGGLTPYDFKPGSTLATTYSFDYNGNTTYDFNKSVGTVYNFLDKPETRIFTATTDENDFAYDANGNKLLDIDYNLGLGDIIEYDGEIQYKSNSLHLISNSQGYSMPNSTGGFDFYYYVRDHLGNVRNVLSSYSIPFDDIPPVEGGGSAYAPVVYHASHEKGSAAIEDMVFDNIDYVRDYKPDATDSSDVMGAHLDAADSTTTIGTTLVLKVMAGDSFSFSAQSYYPSTDTSTGVIDSTQLIDAILGTLVNGTGTASNADANELSDVTKLFSPNNVGLFNAFATGAVDSTIPLAFINYVMYDENFNIIPGSCGRVQISPGPDAWQPLTSPGPISVSHSGYLAVYMSTATIGVAVYIDPMVELYWKGSLVDINHYYPYGLCFNKSTASTTYPIDHNYLYQTTKQDQNNGLYLDDFHARQYNPQLGRFEGVDAHNNFPSGYTGMNNNPVITVDPTGNDGYDWTGGGSSMWNSDLAWASTGISASETSSYGFTMSPELINSGYQMYSNFAGAATMYIGGALLGEVGGFSAETGAQVLTEGDEAYIFSQGQLSAYSVYDNSFIQGLAEHPSAAYSYIENYAPDYLKYNGAGIGLSGNTSATFSTLTSDISSATTLSTPGSFDFTSAINSFQQNLDGQINAIGVTGKIGEDYLKTLGGQSQVYFRTSQGGRYVDQLVNGIANESKVGYQSLTQTNAFQITKDGLLLQNGDVDVSVWHFFTSPVTGQGGPSAPLLDALYNNGILWQIH